MPTTSLRRPTRVLFLNSAGDGGADTAVHMTIIRNLPRDRAEVHVAAQPGLTGRVFQELKTLPHVTLRPTYFGPTLWRQSKLQKIASLVQVAPTMASLLGLVRYMRKNRIEVVHSTDRPRDALSCVMLSALTGAKSVVHAHVNYGAWMSRGVKWAFGRADTLVAVSRFSAQTFIEAGYAPARVHFILNAIDIERWDPEIDPSIGRAALGVPPTAPLIVSIARIFPGKGQRDLLQAVALVKRVLPGVMVAIVGTDFPEGSGETLELKKLAAELGIERNVIYTGHRSDIPNLLAACDVFALPSYEEPFGLVYAEAMAMRRPVVALSTGGAPEVAEHEVSGLLSPRGDTEALSASLLRLLQDPALRAQFGASGRRRVEAHFTQPRLAADVCDLYERLLV